MSDQPTEYAEGFDGVRWLTKDRESELRPPHIHEGREWEVRRAPCMTSAAAIWLMLDKETKHCGGVWVEPMPGAPCSGIWFPRYIDVGPQPFFVSDASTAVVTVRDLFRDELRQQRARTIRRN